MIACGKDDARAQEQLYQQCYAYGITVALYYSSNREEAQEILQDSFLKTFRFLLKGTPPRALKPWFRRTIINTAIDFYRKRNSGWKIFSLAHRRSVENLAVGELNDQDLYQLLQRLPPVYRLVFSLHVLEGYTHAEIAEKLDISTGASKSNLHKARRKLQQLASPFFLIDHKLSNA
ncbi:MAG: sigma-70 family RNA polymerase sigma factor [Bacteroidota bacterium]